MKTETRLVRLDPCPGDGNGANSTPIYQTATFAQRSATECGAYDYTRSGNPTRDVLERQIAALEGASRTLAYTSGMAAIGAALDLVRAGERVLAGSDLYGGSFRLLDRCLGDRGVAVEFVDTTRPELVERAIDSRTRLLLIETPTNPLLQVSDLRALSAICRERGVLLVVDASLMSPLLMQPLKVDIVRHVRERGKFLMANTQPATRTMLRHKIVRFVETGTYSHLVNTHLGCPIGLGNHHAETTHADSTRNVRRTLQHGAVYYGHYYDRDPAPWNFTEVMFPITPVELREGMVLGQERIHTAKSGRFGWPDGSAADIYVVDSQGVRVEDPDVTESVDNGRRMYEIRMPGDHFAVLVRQDSR